MIDFWKTIPVLVTLGAAFIVSSFSKYIVSVKEIVYRLLEADGLLFSLLSSSISSHLSLYYFAL